VVPAFEERVARNEALFREVNERVQELAERFATDPALPPGFVCECSNADCAEHVDVPLEVYERIRGNPRRFVVLPGHVLGEIEHVVEQTERYVVVEKDTPTAIAVSERHDPRR
jgi:hypothetical protein